MTQKIRKTNIIKLSLFLLIIQSYALATSDYLWPTDASKTLTAVFGEIRPFRYHTGIDIRTFGENGHKIYAIEDGYISRILVTTTGYGKTLYLKMKDGNTSVYAHLDRFNKKLELIKKKIQSECNCYSFDESFLPNQIPVKKGEVIGYTGDTGTISGPHLHFEIRNSKGVPFNPLISNYKIKDTIAPVPEKIIFSNTDKDSYINGSKKEKEFSLRKVKDGLYICDEIITVNGEFGISIEVYDKIDMQPFNFGIYSILLEIDSTKIFEAKYNHIDFSEGPKIYNERDYEKYTFDRKKVYNLYKINNSSPSSFINEKYLNRLKLDEQKLYKAKITVSDYNKNKTDIDFYIISKDNQITEFSLSKNKDGFFIESSDITLENLSIQLSDRFDGGIIHNDIDVEKITNQNYFIEWPSFNFDVVVINPKYKSGSTGETQYLSIKETKRKINGKINFLDNERGVVFEFIEDEFTSLSPDLGLLLGNELYKFPLYRTGKNRLTSDIFYPLELRGLTKASVFYNDSSLNEISLDVYSAISISGLPFEMTKDRIQITSDGKPLIKEKFDVQHNTENFIYIRDTETPVNSDEISFYLDPFIFGPMQTPFNTTFNIALLNSNPKLGIYKYDSYKKKWNFLNNKKFPTGRGASVKSGGIFAVIKDEVPPQISRIVPKINSTYRALDLNRIKFHISDELSGIADENNFRVLLDGEELIVEYNSYQKKVIHYIDQKLTAGKHDIIIEVIDNSNNMSRIEGDFYIK